MNEQEQRMLVFATLAQESKQKGQESGYLRFVILTGIAACRSGWGSIASRCRELVLASNPQHLLRNFDSLESALRSEDFLPFLHHLDRFCTFERAEHLLEQLQIDISSGEGTSELDEAVLKLLGTADE